VDYAGRAKSDGQADSPSSVCAWPPRRHRLVLLRPSFASAQSVVTIRKLLSSSTVPSMKDPPTAPKQLAMGHPSGNFWSGPEVKDACKGCKRRQIEVILLPVCRGFAQVRPPAKHDGKRTDIGQCAAHPDDQAPPRPDLRGILIFTDRSGQRHALPGRRRRRPSSAVCLARSNKFGVGWRRPARGRTISPCVDVKSDPERVYVKTKWKVKATIDAPGLADRS